MNDTHSVLASIERSARSVARWSAATRVIAGAMLLIALIMLLYAFSQADRRTDDFVGFGLLSVGIAALALVFGSTASFHAAFGDAMRLAAATHLRVEQLARAQERWLAHPGAVAPAARAEAPPAPPAEPAGGERPPLPGPAAAPLAQGAAAPGPGNAAAKVEPPAPKAPAQPATKTCPACRAEIRADALRCRNCFERV